MVASGPGVDLRRPAELGRQDDERSIEKPFSFEIVDHGADLALDEHLRQDHRGVAVGVLDDAVDELVTGTVQRVDAHALLEIGLRPNGPIQIYQPEGCAGCNYTGYRGRVGIFEMMQIDDDIRALVTQNIDSKTIKNKAVSKGMHTLRYDGARKVLAGITSVAEILRATEEEAAVAQI